MDPATILLLLKAALTGLPLLMEQYRLLVARGEYTDTDRAVVKALFAKYKIDPAWKEEPDPAPGG